MVKWEHGCIEFWKRPTTRCIALNVDGFVAPARSATARSGPNARMQRSHNGGDGRGRGRLMPTNEPGGACANCAGQPNDSEPTTTIRAVPEGLDATSAFAAPFACHAIYGSNTLKECSTGRRSSATSAGFVGRRRVQRLQQVRTFVVQERYPAAVNEATSCGLFGQVSPRRPYPMMP